MRGPCLTVLLRNPGAIRRASRCKIAPKPALLASFCPAHVPWPSLDDSDHFRVAPRAGLARSLSGTSLCGISGICADRRAGGSIMSGQAITFDFHNTLATCPEWFELEVRHLPSAFLRWWSDRDGRQLAPAHTRRGGCPLPAATPGDHRAWERADRRSLSRTCLCRHAASRV